MKNIFLSILFILPTYVFSQLDGCEKFKDGRFSYPEIPNVLSVRKGKTQKSYANGKLQALWDVKWIDACSYELTCKKVKAKNVPFRVGDHIKAEIISIEGECISIKTALFRNGLMEGGYRTSDMCAE